jgi:hypothetical protein
MRRSGARAAGIVAAWLTMVGLFAAIPAQAGASRLHRHRDRETRVLQVGTWDGHRGGFDTIQGAVDAARPGDWILIAPGDYHERGDYTGHQVAPDKSSAGVLIRTPRIHLRGLDRNRVVIDGTKPGSKRCDPSPAAQDLGPLNGAGHPAGRNGIEVFEADGVSIENLTVCNFLDGANGGGNQIWFNGGDGSGQVHLGSFHGAYLSATSTYYAGSSMPRAEYGIFVSNARGPGVIAHTYASNMADSSYYVGACPDCNTVLTDAHAQNSALGYSGTNAGGHLVIESSEWDHNKTGISTNSQNNDDAPSPQSGACPGSSPVRSCTFFRHNWIHDNNNANVPQSGSAGLGPVGTGMVVAGGRFDTITMNRFERNGAWGLLLVPFPDGGTPPAVAHCEGGDQQPGLCFYDDWGSEVVGNRFRGNGFFANPTNGDGGEISGLHDPGNCWHDNVDRAGFTGAPDNLQVTHGKCRVPNHGADLGAELTAQVICDTEVFGPCADAPGKHYPRATTVALLALPRQRSMPEVCDDVSSRSWC